MKGETFLLLLRLGFSLSLVFGLMWVAGKVIRGRGASLLRQRVDHLEVIERKPLGKGSAIAIVRVGDETLTLGITEHAVSLLGPAGIELPEPEVAAVELTAAEPVTHSVPVAGLTPAALAVAPGRRRSILDSLRDKTVRHVAR